MNRIAAFALALSASLSAPGEPARAAEAVEAAISDLIAAIDAAPDWSARFSELAYDQATDTAVLRGLTIVHLPGGTVIRFEPISATGYAEHADGTFGADTIVAEGAIATAADFEATVVDVRLDGLGNIDKAFGSTFEWDLQRPFTSLIRVYAQFLDIRLAHASLASASISAKDENGAHTFDFYYHDLEVEGWGDGKIARATTGELAMISLEGADPFSMTIASTESRNIDYAAMLRIYDPDQYIGGVGDGIWRTAAELVGYDEIVFDTSEAKVTLGGLRMQDFRVRQPERGVGDFLDRAMLDPDANQEPTPEEFRTALEFLSSFEIGSIAVSDIDIEARDGGGGYLGGINLLETSFNRIGELIFDDLKLPVEDDGVVGIGRLALGDIVFPPPSLVVDAFEAKETGEEFDFTRFATRLGYFEARAIDVTMSDEPFVKLDKARVDLGNHVGFVPTAVTLEIAGADLPAAAIESPMFVATWQSLGYDRIRGALTAGLAWNEDNETLAIDAVRLSIDDVGVLSLNMLLGGLDRQSLEQLHLAPEALAEMTFIGGALALQDYDVLDRWIDLQAAATDADPSVLRQQIASWLSELASNIGDSGFRGHLNRALQAAVMVPGSISATAAPPEPIPLFALKLLAQIAPESLPDLLGLTVESTPGKAP